MFPLGILSYLVGGLIIGCGVAFIFVFTGLHATQSSFFDTTLSYLSKRQYFQQIKYISSRDWRIVLAIGLVTGAYIYTITVSQSNFYTTSVQVWRLVVGGFLVGFGTRLSQGCTSGHGISGIASLSVTSVYAVLTFIIVGIITAMVIQFIGVVP